MNRASQVGKYAVCMLNARDCLTVTNIGLNRFNHNFFFG